MILLDAAYPPSPAQLVRDCQSAGAAGCWVYCWGPFTNYSRAHIDGLHSAGLRAPAIIVPGNAPGAWQPMLEACDALGCDPPTAFDLETGSLPPAAWLRVAIGATRAWGRRPLRYGDAPVLAGYPGADGDWLSHRSDLVVRAGWRPPPALPAACVAWQYVVRAQINGSEYDVSVTDPSVFAGGDSVDLANPVDAQLVKQVQDLWVMLVQDGDIAEGTGGRGAAKVMLEQLLAATGGTGAGVLADVDAVRAELQALKAELDAIHAGGGGPCDLSSVLERMDKLAAHLGQGTP